MGATVFLHFTRATTARACCVRRVFSHCSALGQHSREQRLFSNWMELGSHHAAAILILLLPLRFLLLPLANVSGRELLATTPVIVVLLLPLSVLLLPLIAVLTGR